MPRFVRLLPLMVLLALPLAACGSKSGGQGDDAGTVDGNGTGIDATGTGGDGNNVAPDAPPGAGGCSANQPQCNNCIDDDGDGLIDGDDPECTGAIDNDESSFATGIPGDNIDAKNQDCYFDGNSGAGDDRCNVKTCCILGYTTQQCRDAGLGNNFDPANDCPAPSQQCIDNCQPLTPPGCDCFGCCTICDAAGCVDIEISPSVDPDCSAENPDTLHDPSSCFTCVKNTACGSPCGGDTCILCPGQDPSTLPPACNQTTSCPGSAASCDAQTACPDPTTQYCSNGCCIGIVG